MKDPYEVLEIRQGATEDEIKAAYKRLVKKYHPDQYANNPLSDLAQEKIKEINEAYDSLTKSREGTNYNRGSQGQRQSYSQSQQSQDRKTYSSPEYVEIRTIIEQNNLNLADQLLDRIVNRNAEWNYLKGIVLLKRGWYDQAFRYITVATNLDPYNSEYRDMLNSLKIRAHSYNQFGNYRGYDSGGSFCNICGSLLIADCCCECMGGDFISCC